MSFANETWLGISNAADGNGTGLPTDPYVVNTPTSFATKMESIPANRVIRLGPGIFTTRGTTGNGYVVVDPADVWAPKSGQKIIGAGVFSTILRFVWDLPPNIDPNQAYHPGQRHNMIFSGDYLSSLELSDLTLDCNLQNAPFGPTKDSGSITGSTQTGTPLPKVTSSAGFFTADMVGATIVFPNKNPVFTARIMEYVSTQEVKVSAYQAITNLPFQVFGVRFSITALSVVGDNVRIRRVRVINFGTRTPYYFDGLSTYPGPNRTYEGFPLRVEGRSATKASFNSVIEDCIFEQPFCASGRETTCAVMGGGVYAPASSTQRLHLQPFGSVLRNCYFNFDYINPLPGNPVKIVSSAYANGEVTVTTEFPVDVEAGDFVEIYLCNVSGLNGRFPVDSVVDPDATSKLVLGFRILFGSDPGTANTGFAFKSPAQTMPISSITRSSRTITVTTATKHKRLAGDYVAISGAEQEGYNGTFKVDSPVPTEFSFTCTLEPNNTPSSPASGPMFLDRRPSSTIRIANASVDNTTKIATITTYGPHFCKPGDWIQIANISAGASPTVNNAYNNYSKVVAIGDEPNTPNDSRHIFQVQLYSLKNTEMVNIPGSGDPSFAGGFQAYSNNGGLGGGTFSNRIANCGRAGTYHDTWWEVQFIARRNYCYNVGIGPAMVFDAISFYISSSGGPITTPEFLAATITKDPANSRFRVVLASGVNPGYVPGLAMRIIQGTNTVDGEISDFNAAHDFYVRVLPTTNFNNFSDTTATATLWFQQSMFHFEDNIIEVALERAGGTNNPPAGIAFAGPTWSSPLRGLNNGASFPSIMRNVIIREKLRRSISRRGERTDFVAPPSQSPGICSVGTPRHCVRRARKLKRGSFSTDS